MKYHTFDNFAALTEALSQQWLDVIKTTPNDSNASFALAGGSTPAPVYQRLDQLLSDIDGHQPIKLVATDERWVPDQDTQSNEGLFRRCLSGSAIDKRWKLVSLKNAASNPEVATEAINARLNEQLPQAFSAVLLGMGADGHIASLFPGAPTQHDDLACLAAVHPQTRQSRMSLSLPRLLNTQRIWLVITGVEKRQVLDRAMEENLPVASLLRDAGCTIDVFWCP
ncbi:6-phosphogluconolactonase [Undibacterium sp. TS12]|uniref:6-phosphogluconolactonase n=1 Tax=Undibacterium sp. TS12 TaxID=2908202 RepID=UPI001F4D0DB7|nr:6-phosphogluconolactonase [Undibacterium sp. TS12]MCH8619889.1 6-phosphogluconolactonase [Undibacterium sp. TS12]